MTNTDYQVVVTMSTQTVTKLVKSGFYLYGFKAVQSSDLSGRPLIWLKTQDYSTNTMLPWSQQYQAYTSSSQIIPGNLIRVGFAVDIALGQILSVEPGGIGEVTSGGSPAAISILNTTNDEFTCGISQMVDSAVNPMCALPLNGNNLQSIPPIEKVLLMFSTQSFDVGVVIERLDSSGGGASGPGILIDLTDNNQRDVTYDANDGWSWGNFTWAQQVPATSDLVSLLIENL